MTPQSPEPKALRDGGIAGVAVALSGGVHDASEDLALAFALDPEHPLLRFSSLLSRCYALSQDAALALTLAAVAGTVGRARQIINPLGGVLPGSLNVMVISSGNPPGLNAVRLVAAPLVEFAEVRAETKRLKGAPRLRKERIALEQHGTFLRGELAKAQEAAAEERRDRGAAPNLAPMAERSKLCEECEAVAKRLMELEIEDRPWLVCDGLKPNEIREFSSLSFDRSLLNYSPEGHAWNTLLNSKPSAQAEVLRVLRAGFRGESFVQGTETIVGVIISNLWVIENPSKRGRGFDAIRADPLWDTFLFADIRDTESDLEPALLESTGEVSWWRDVIAEQFRPRAQGATILHTLTDGAKQVFVAFCNAHRREFRHVDKEIARFASRRPEQVLKIALLLHLFSENLENVEIEEAMVNIAISIAKRLGQGPGSSWSAEPQVTIEVEVQRMVCKLRLSGPSRKRDFYRRFNCQDYARLDPILQRAVETKQISVEGDIFAAAN